MGLKVVKNKIGEFAKLTKGHFLSAIRLPHSSEKNQISLNFDI